MCTYYVVLRMEGFRPNGIKKTLESISGQKRTDLWMQNSTCLSAGVLVSRANAYGSTLQKTIGRLCEEAPFVDGKQLVTVAVAGRKVSDRGWNPRSYHFVGDDIDIATFWASLTHGESRILRGPDPYCAGMYWTGMNQSHVWVPYLDFDEQYPTRDGFSEIWRDRVEPGISRVQRAFYDIDQSCDRHYTLFYNSRCLDNGMWKYSFHVHFINIGVYDIGSFKQMLSTLTELAPDIGVVPRKREWVDGAPVDIQNQSLYDLAVYGGVKQIFRGPYCGKMGKENAKMFPIRVNVEIQIRICEERAVYWPQKDDGDGAISRILEARLRVPLRSDMTMLNIVVVDERKQYNMAGVVQERVPSDVSTNNKYLEFYAPFLTYEIIPCWQKFRRAKLASVMNCVGATVPTTSLVMKTKDMARHYERFIQVENDTFCMTDSNHCHRSSPHAVGCMVNLLDCLIWQTCVACGRGSQKFHFMKTSGEFEIHEEKGFDTNSVYPSLGVRWHSVFLSYFREELVRQRDGGLWVFDEENKVWTCDQSGNRICGKLLDMLNHRWRSYRIQVTKDITDRLCTRATEEKQRSKLNEDAKKMISKLGLMCSYTTSQRGVLMKEMLTFPILNVVDEMDCFSMLVPMSDGQYYNVYTGTTMPIKKDHYFTSICNAELTNENLDTVNDWFLEISTGDQEKSRLLKMIGGYCMTMLTHDRKFYALMGNGKNGKGLFKSFLTTILGGVNGTASRWSSLSQCFWEVQRNTNSENATPVTYGLKSKSLYYTDDMSRVPINSGRLKSVVSHEVVSGRALYAMPEKIVPTGKVLWTTNHYVKLSGTDNAVWERFVLITMKAKYVEDEKMVDHANWKFIQDKAKYDHLLTLKDAFFTVCLGALTDYYRDLIGDGAVPTVMAPFPLPLTVRQDIQTARNRELPLSRFMDEYTGIGGQVRVEELFDNFMMFLDHENEGAERRRTTLQGFESQLANALDLVPENGVLMGRYLSRVVEPKHSDWGEKRQRL